MATAVVTVAGRSYRIGCEEGQELRLDELARMLDGKIAVMRKNFGEIGDQRIVVMAALEVADEAADAKDRILALETEIQSLREALADRERRANALEEMLAQSVEAAAARLERLARDLGRDELELELP